MSLPTESADQAVELERHCEETWEKLLESADSGDQTSSDACNIIGILFQRAIVRGGDYGLTVIADGNIVEEGEQMKDGLKRVGGQQA